MSAASVVSFVVCWLRQGEFPSQGEDRQHIRLRCTLHARKISFGPVVSFCGCLCQGGTLASWGSWTYRGTMEALHIGFALPS